jgi:hypothetical protein
VVFGVECLIQPLHQNRFFKKIMVITDNEIKLQGLNALVNFLGEIKAERFISLILRELFDYTVSGCGSHGGSEVQNTSI